MQNFHGKYTDVVKRIGRGVGLLGDEPLDAESKVVLLVDREPCSIEHELNYPRASCWSEKIRGVDVEEVFLVAAVDCRELVPHGWKYRRVHVVPAHELTKKGVHFLQELVLTDWRYFQAFDFFHRHSQLQDFGVTSQNFTRG